MTAKSLKCMLKRPEAAHLLLRLATDYAIEVAQYWKDTFSTDSVLPWSAEPTAANDIAAASPKSLNCISAVISITISF